MSALPDNIIRHPLLAVWDALKERGIESVARHEQMRPTARKMAGSQQFGVVYVCRDIHGKPVPGTDSKPLERWKRTSKSNDPDMAKDLYYTAGQKPQGSRPLMVSRDGVQPDADGTLYVVEGFADWLSMLAAGYKNTIGIFGGTGIPDDIAAQAASINVAQIMMFVHPDDAGTAYAQSLADKAPELQCIFYRLPTESGQKRDINDLWIASGFNTESFDKRLWTLETFTLTPTPKRAYTPRPVTTKEATSDQVQAYVKKAMDGVLADLSKVSSGRNNALTAAAARAGNFVGAGWMTDTEAESQLLGVALSIGLKEREATATIRSGLKVGLSTPATLPERPVAVEKTSGAKLTIHARARVPEPNPVKDLLAQPTTQVFKRGLPYMVYAAIGLTLGAAAKVACKILIDAIANGLITEPFDPLRDFDHAAEEQGLSVNGKALQKGIKTLQDAGLIVGAKLTTDLIHNTSVQNCAFPQYGLFISRIASHPALRRSIITIYGSAEHGELIKPEPILFDGFEGAPNDPEFAYELASYLPPGTEMIDTSAAYGRYCVNLARAYTAPPFPLQIPDEGWTIEKPSDFDTLIWRSYAVTKQPDRSTRWKMCRLVGCTSRSTILNARKRAGVESIENFAMIPVKTTNAIQATRDVLTSTDHYPLAIKYIDAGGKAQTIFASYALKNEQVLDRLTGAQSIAVKVQLASTERLITEEKPPVAKQEALPFEKPAQTVHKAPKERKPRTVTTRWQETVRSQLALALAVMELSKDDPNYVHEGDNRDIAAAVARERHAGKTSAELIGLIRDVNAPTTHSALLEFAAENGGQLTVVKG